MMAKIKKDKNGKMIGECLFCDDFIDSGKIDCSLLNKKFEFYSNTGVSLEDCPLDDYYDPNQKIKIFAYVGNVDSLIESGTKCFPTKLGEQPLDTEKEFYNYVLFMKNKFTDFNSCNIHLIANEMIVNLLGHMVYKGFPVDPKVIAIDENGNKRISTYSDEGYLENWSFGYLSWNSDMFNIRMFDKDISLCDEDLNKMTFEGESKNDK